jgi:hypothetical protein
MVKYGILVKRDLGPPAEGAESFRIPLWTVATYPKVG